MILNQEAQDLAYFRPKLWNLQSTPDNSNLPGKSKKVRVIECSKQITRNKEISKWMGKECKSHADITSRAARNKVWYFEKGIEWQSLIDIEEWTLNLNWRDKKVMTKNWNGCFEINIIGDEIIRIWTKRAWNYSLISLVTIWLHLQILCTPFFFPTCHALKTWLELSRKQLYRNYLKGKQKLLRVIWRFKLSRVRVTEGKLQ